MGPHRLDEPDSLGVSRDREGPLDDVVTKGVGHKVLDLLGVADLPEVELLGLVVGFFEALLHDVAAELLDGKHADPAG